MEIKENGLSQLPRLLPFFAALNDTVDVRFKYTQTLCRPGTESAPRASRECPMGKKTKKPGKGKEKTEKKTAKAEEKKARRESKKLSPEDDIDAILVFIFGISLRPPISIELLD